MSSRAPRHTLRRLLPAVAVGVALFPASSAVAAQETGSDGARTATVPIRPVPDLVRAALSRPDDAATWTGLAHALPGLALDPDADPQAVLEASRLADSLSRVPVVPVASPEVTSHDDARSGAPLAASARATGELPPAAGTVAAFRALWAAASHGFGRLAGRARAVELDADTAMTWGPWILVLALLGAGPLLRRSRTRRARPAPAAHATAHPRARAADEAAPDARSRTWTVATLAENGLPPSEIARRTGMSQDAVQVLLGLRSTPSGPSSRPGARIPRHAFDVPAFGTGTRPSAPRPPSMTEQAAGVAVAREQLEQGTRRLSGGRLTYGPEHRA